MNMRIKKIRKALDLTQQEFASRIGTTANVLTNYETGRRNPSKSVINNICKEFRVNEEWFRTGTGEMFVQNDDTIVSEVTAQYHLEDMEKEILRIFLELDANQRAAVKDFAFSLVDAVLNTPSLQSEYFSRTDGSVPIAAMGGGVRTIGRKQFDDDLISHPDSDNDDLKG